MIKCRSVLGVHACIWHGLYHLPSLFCQHRLASVIINKHGKSKYMHDFELGQLKVAKIVNLLSQYGFLQAQKKQNPFLAMGPT